MSNYSYGSSGHTSQETSRYDKYIPIFRAGGKAGDNNTKFLPLFLHEIEKNFKGSPGGAANGNIKYNTEYHAVADAHWHAPTPNYNGGSHQCLLGAVKATKSPLYLQFMTNMLEGIQTQALNQARKNEIRDLVRGLGQSEKWVAQLAYLVYDMSGGILAPNRPLTSLWRPDIADQKTTYGRDGFDLNSTADFSNGSDPRGDFRVLRPGEVLWGDASGLKLGTVYATASNTLTNAAWTDQGAPCAVAGSAANGGPNDAEIAAAVTAANAIVAVDWYNNTAPNTPVDFPFRMNKYLLSYLLKSAATTAATSSGSSSFWNNIGQNTINDEKIYFRKPSDPSKLYRRKNDGTDEVVKGPQDDIPQGNYCFNLGFISNDLSLNCSTLIRDCMSGKDVAKCNAYMKDTRWYQNAKDSVDNMYPEIAMNMLRSFGFEAVNTTQGGQTIKQVQTVGQWIDTLKEKHVPNSLSANDVNDITNNQPLNSYLKLLIEKINNNPAILNPTYTGQAPSGNNNSFNGTTLSNYGVKPKASGGPIAGLQSSIYSLQNTALSNRNTILALWGMPFKSGLIFQRGGNYNYYETLSNDNMYPLKLSSMLRRSLHGFIENLQNNGKDLDKDDQNKINELLGNLETVENKLIKAAIYTDKYRQLVEVFGQLDEENSKILNMDNVEKFVEKRNNYFNRVNTQQDQLISILKALADATGKEISDKSDNKTDNKYVPL